MRKQYSLDNQCGGKFCKLCEKQTRLLASPGVFIKIPFLNYKKQENPSPDHYCYINKSNAEQTRHIVRVGRL